MSEKELVDEFYDGVRMFGYQHIYYLKNIGKYHQNKLKIQWF